MNHKKHESNLAISGIAFFLFARWQQQFANFARFVCGVRPPNFSFPRVIARPI